MKETLLKYLSQASTYKGIFALLGAFGIVISPELSTQIIATCLGIIGIINVIIDERKAKDL